MVAHGRFPPRPGVERLLPELEERGIRLAVATTGSRAWVTIMLDRLFGRDRFEVVVTADEAPVRKPDPSAYLSALRRLGVAPVSAVAIEDSANGLRAAAAAGLRCVIVVNGYTSAQCFDGGDLVLDGFGDPGVPATLLHNPRALAVRDVVDAALLIALTTAAPNSCRRIHSAP